MLPGELAKHAVSEGTKAVTKVRLLFVGYMLMIHLSLTWTFLPIRSSHLVKFFPGGEAEWSG
jgi:hypothetical protein